MASKKVMATKDSIIHYISFRNKLMRSRILDRFMEGRWLGLIRIDRYICYRKGPPVAMKTRRLLTSIEGLLPQTATP